MFGERTILLDWQTPVATRTDRPQNDRPVIVFPASTVGRKGCYELREAIRDLDIKLITLGPFIEDPDFWNGFDVERGGHDWLDRADAVILPAFVEHRPRRLLSAAANGVPVIASPECGVSNVAGVIAVASGDADHLRSTLLDLINHA